MEDSRDQIKELTSKIEALAQQHEKMRNEINGLIRELKSLTPPEKSTQTGNIVSADLSESGVGTLENPAKEPQSSGQNILPGKPVEESAKPVPAQSGPWPNAKTVQPLFQPAAQKSGPLYQLELEKFIGENLINKIGIIITIIGVAIGTKYAIDHQLISPLTRIILGYLVGLGLAGFSIKLKRDYKSFSALLLSGAMAIMYFVTFFAYSFYDLLPQLVAFLLMVLFTVVTVKAALDYDIQVIAHIGLVGAYAVPFLLSDNSGRVHILFGYITIINCGILFMAFKRLWKPLFNSSFILSWLIYLSWYAGSYISNQHFTVALVFLTLFFSIFFIAFLALKLKTMEGQTGDMFAALLANGILFFGLGYAILNGHASGTHYTGLFAQLCGCAWLAAWAILRKMNSEDFLLHFFLQTIAWIFLTLSVSIQLDGYQVTMIWAAEAALMYWASIMRKNKFFEFFSYPLMFLVFCSLVHDWILTYAFPTAFTSPASILPFFNTTFLTSLWVAAIFSCITFLHTKGKASFIAGLNAEVKSIINAIVPAMLVIVLYFAFELELSEFFHQLYMHTGVIIPAKEDLFGNTLLHNRNILNFGTIWTLNYTMFFLTLLTQFAGRKFTNSNAKMVLFWLNMATMGIFLLVGLFTLSVLRNSFLHPDAHRYFPAGMFNIYIRYIAFFFFGLLGWEHYSLMKTESIWPEIKNRMEVVFYIATIWLLTSELIHWLDILGSDNLYKLGVSILWGVCSLLLIILGIWKSKKHLRLMAIALFGITLLKLFFYDIAELDTILKTILFVSLGLLLLIISFLYNKYKNLITED